LPNKKSRTETPSLIDAIIDEIDQDEGKSSVICAGTRSGGFVVMEEDVKQYKSLEAGYGHHPTASNVAGLNDNCLEAAC
jgi:hypothetical protein